MKKAFTKIAELIFDEQESILHIRPLEGVDIDVKNTKEHYEHIKELTNNKPYGALIDASVHFSVDSEAMEFSSLPETIGNRIASAHYQAPLSNKLTAKVFKNRYKPKIHFQSFKTKEEAVLWLKEKLSKTIKL